MSTAYAEAILSDNPAGYWRLGEPSGTVAADELGVSNGTYTGSPTLAVAGALDVDSNGGVLFNGTSQYVSVANTTAINQGNGPLGSMAHIAVYPYAMNAPQVLRHYQAGGGGARVSIPLLMA